MFVRAVEENDPDGILLPFGERASASRKAKPPIDDWVPLEGVRGHRRKLTFREQGFLIRRSEILMKYVESSLPRAVRLVTQFDRLGGVETSVIILAFFAGLLSYSIEKGGKINLLFLPFLGLLIWNFGLYVFSSFRWIVRSDRDWHSRAPSLLAAWMLRLRRSVSGDKSEPAITTSILASFFKRWQVMASCLYRIRTRALLHFAAIAVALGTLSGLYLRGLAFEYQVGWSSTFLKAEQVRSVLNWVLSPGRLMTGFELPSLQTFETLRWEVENDEVDRRAASWIHVYAISILGFIVIPRGILAVIALEQADRFGRDLPFGSTDDPYFRSLVRVSHGKGERVAILPYNRILNSTERDAAKRLAFDLLGSGAEVRAYPPLLYGSEEAFEFDELCQGGALNYLFAIFGMESTPEREAHGLMLDRIRAMMMRGELARNFLILVNESTYRARFKDQSEFERRLSERADCWRRFFDEYQMSCVFIDLSRSNPLKGTHFSVPEVVWAANQGQESG